MYYRFITPSAKRSLKRLPCNIKQDIIDATKILESNPYVGGKLSGSLSFLYSFHFKSDNVNYRVAYTIKHKEKQIIIHFAGVRENFYKKLRRIFQ